VETPEKGEKTMLWEEEVWNITWRRWVHYKRVEGPSETLKEATVPKEARSNTLYRVAKSKPRKEESRGKRGAPTWTHREGERSTEERSATQRVDVKHYISGGIIRTTSATTERVHSGGEEN